MTEHRSSFAAFAVEWLAAFNAHEVDWIMSHYPVHRPMVSWRLMLAFGLITGIGQFGALATAMQGQVSAGLASDRARPDEEG